MKQLLIIVTAAMVFSGCAKNDIEVANKGTMEWQQIEIKAGGHVFEIRQLKVGATESFRFKSKAEDGGQVSGNLNGQVHKAEFGYFTPNLSTRHQIIFDDNGTITITGD